jgi:hypothetical protein
MDDALYDNIEEFKKQNGTSLNYLMEKLLRQYFIREE